MDRLQSFHLSVEEGVGIELEEKDVAFSTDECGRCLVGKIFGEKRVNFVGLRNTMTSIWPLKSTVKIRELGINLFQFVFANLEDMKRVVNGRVWTFNQQYLILKEWKESMNVHTEAFNSVQIWVQMWNVPLKWMSKEVGAKMGKLFSQVSEVLIPETGSSRGRCIKILATVNLEKPLLRGANIKLGSEVCWVDFKYEQIAAFCFYCGRVGYTERVCASRGEDLRLNRLKNGQYGDWLKGVGRSSEGKTGGGRLIHHMVQSREEKENEEEEKRRETLLEGWLGQQGRRGGWRGHKVSKE